MSEKQHLNYIYASVIPTDDIFLKANFFAHIENTQLGWLAAM